MATNRVQRVQELRRSNAAQPVPGKRPTGPSAQEWDEDDDTPGREIPKELREIVATLRAQGWRYKAPRNGHPALYAPDGRNIIRMAGTASDHRARKNLIADIRRAGGIL